MCPDEYPSSSVFLILVTFWTWSLQLATYKIYLQVYLGTLSRDNSNDNSRKQWKIAVWSACIFVEFFDVICLNYVVKFPTLCNTHNSKSFTIKLFTSLTLLQFKVLGSVLCQQNITQAWKNHHKMFMFVQMFIFKWSFFPAVVTSWTL